jgi:hypothetical protein
VTWKQTSKSYLGGCDVITEHCAEEDLYRVTIQPGAGLRTYSVNQFEARRQMADRLEVLLRELRK